MKYCVFCGNKPASKNKEHVIPQWLIKKTGDPNRKALFVTDLSLAQGKQRSYAFDQFTFPACEQCNNQYSALEIRAQKILERIEFSNNITGNDLSVFFDWLDKVRVGIWLGYNQLDRKILDVQPKFHISTRIGQHDRALIIQKSDTDRKRLNIIGTNTVSFADTPSAFGIVINNLYFTNISYNHLLARRCGFPYPTNTQWEPEQRGIIGDLVKGTERITSPIIRRSMPANAAIFYQPMLGRKLNTIDDEYYNTEYVRLNCIDFEKGIGAIFESTSRGIKKHLADDLISPSPKKLHSDLELFHETTIEAYSWQNWFHTLHPSLDLLDKEERKSWTQGAALVRQLNNKWINHTKLSLKKIRLQKKTIKTARY
ncbi:hypothetical protein AB1288_07615 [Pseudomonas putida]|uniref:hypothetical protein n=1 Tax=Pseudomonas putida TaxID=303 RepID=UPI00345D9BAE